MKRARSRWRPTRPPQAASLPHKGQVAKVLTLQGFETGLFPKELVRLEWLAGSFGVAPNRGRRSVRMPAATLRVAEALPLVFDAIAFDAALAAISFLYGIPEHLVMPFQALDVIG